MASPDFPTKKELNAITRGEVAKRYKQYGCIPSDPEHPYIPKPVLIAKILKKVQEIKASKNRKGDGREEGGDEEGPVEAQDERDPDDTGDPPEGRPVPNQQSIGTVATVSQEPDGGSPSEDQIDGTER